MKFVKFSVLALSLGLFVASCGNGGSEATETPATTEAVAPEATTTPEAAPATTTTDSAAAAAPATATEAAPAPAAH